MKKRIFWIAGQRPIEPHSSFMRACDLGIDAVTRPFVDKCTVTVADDCTPEQYAAQMDGVKHAYQHVGCLDVRIMEEETR